MRVEERFNYQSVDIDTGAIVLAGTDTASAAYLVQHDSGYADRGIGDDEPRQRVARTREACESGLALPPAGGRTDSLRAVMGSARAKGDTATARRIERGAPTTWPRAFAPSSVAGKECARDSTYYAGSTSRYDGALRMAIRMPCDTSRLAMSPELPASIYDDGEQVFGVSERDALIDALGMNLQPGWLPQPPVFRTGLDLVRFNQIEGLSSARRSPPRSARDTPRAPRRVSAQRTWFRTASCRWRDRTARPSCGSRRFTDLASPTTTTERRFPSAPGVESRRCGGRGLLL